MHYDIPSFGLPRAAGASSSYRVEYITIITSPTPRIASAPSFLRMGVLSWPRIPSSGAEMRDGKLSWTPDTWCYGHWFRSFTSNVNVHFVVDAQSHWCRPFYLDYQIRVWGDLLFDIVQKRSVHTLSLSSNILPSSPHPLHVLHAFFPSSFCCMPLSCCHSIPWSPYSA